MKHFLIGVTLAATVVTTIGPAWAQAPAWVQPPWSPAVYPGTYQYPFAAPTPRDAYRQGLINRWELERFEGPTPQALQGPSPDGAPHGGGDSRGS
jgi:hypothetical protein